MDIIKIKLNQTLHQMVEEVVEEYQLSPDEIILNTLDHFIKDKKDFLGMLARIRGERWLQELDGGDVENARWEKALSCLQMTFEEEENEEK